MESYAESYQRSFNDAFILKLSGTGEFKNDKEMWWNDSSYGQRTTIEFPDDSPNTAVLRFYQRGENTDWYMYSENHFCNGELHGECRVLCSAKGYEDWWLIEEWINGKRVGGCDE